MQNAELKIMKLIRQLFKKNENMKKNMVIIEQIIRIKNLGRLYDDIKIIQT